MAGKGGPASFFHHRATRATRLHSPAHSLGPRSSVHSVSMLNLIRSILTPKETSLTAPHFNVKTIPFGDRWIRNPVRSWTSILSSRPGSRALSIWVLVPEPIGAVGYRAHWDRDRRYGKARVLLLLLVHGEELNDFAQGFGGKHPVDAFCFSNFYSQV